MIEDGIWLTSLWRIYSILYRESEVFCFLPCLLHYSLIILSNLIKHKSYLLEGIFSFLQQTLVEHRRRYDSWCILTVTWCCRWPTLCWGSEIDFKPQIEQNKRDRHADLSVDDINYNFFSRWELLHSACCENYFFGIDTLVWPITTSDVILKRQPFLWL